MQKPNNRTCSKNRAWVGLGLQTGWAPSACQKSHAPPRVRTPLKHGKRPSCSSCVEREPGSDRFPRKSPAVNVRNVGAFLRSNFR